jgi:hypothetical protein
VRSTYGTEHAALTWEAVGVVTPKPHDDPRTSSGGLVLSQSEITGLRWSDVDLAKRRIVVRRNRASVRAGAVEQPTTKTRAGLCMVTLSDFVW